MTATSTGALEWLVVGCLLTTAGSLIRLRGWTFLLAGYDEASSVSDDIVRDVAGNAVLRSGIVAVAFGVLAVATTPPSYLAPVIGAGILLDVLRMIHRVNTHVPSEA